MDGAPNLPCGYGTLIGLTYLPPLWRRLMDIGCWRTTAATSRGPT